MFDDFLQSYEEFERSNVENPLSEALRLHEIISGSCDPEPSVADPVQINMRSVVEQRKQGVPLEHILGRTRFMGRLFLCSRDTFLPTECTRLIVEAALHFIHAKEQSGQELVIADIGTGCGNLAINLALNTRNTRVFASDIAPGAVEVARQNVRIHALESRVIVSSGDLFSPLLRMGYEGKIDVIVCNPPYIPSGSLPKLSRRLTDYEPRIALDGGPYGIDLYRRLIAESCLMLKPGGMLLFEIGERQEKLVMRLFERRSEYREIEYLREKEKVRGISAIKKEAAS